MIGFQWKRGNVEKQWKELERAMSTELELRSISLKSLQKAFERVQIRPFRVTNPVGRPIKTNHKAVQDIKKAMEQLNRAKGQTEMFKHGFTTKFKSHDQLTHKLANIRRQIKKLNEAV